MAHIITYTDVSFCPRRCSCDVAAASARGVFVKTDTAESILEAWGGGIISLEVARERLDYEETRPNAGGLELARAQAGQTGDNSVAECPPHSRNRTPGDLVDADHVVGCCWKTHYAGSKPAGVV